MTETRKKLTKIVCMDRDLSYCLWVWSLKNVESVLIRSTVHRWHISWTMIQLRLKKLCIVNDDTSKIGLFSSIPIDLWSVLLRSLSFRLCHSKLNNSTFIALLFSLLVFVNSSLLVRTACMSLAFAHSHSAIALIHICHSYTWWRFTILLLCYVLMLFSFETHNGLKC